MQIGSPNQISSAEQRVSITPDVATRLAKQGFSVIVESGAGMAAGFPDQFYEEAGATIVDAASAWGAELVVCLSAPTDDQIGLLRRGGILLGLLEPLDKAHRAKALAAAGVTSLAFETLPRTTRAQPMDVLSSQATAAGYQAVLIAAVEHGKFFPMLTTAAGTIRPTKALVLGAGVAGLQAIATAKRLGAIVSAYDVRAAAAEQVESLGARFVHLEIEQQDETKTGGYARELEADAQQRLLMQLGDYVARHDVVISTAAIPGRKAPMLVTRDMVERMAPGSVIVDLAVATGGNCELSKADEKVIHNGVIIIAPTDLVSGVATHASQMYARNAAAVLVHLLQEGGVVINFSDEITSGLCITHEGRVVNERVKSMLEGGSG
jgi:NAD(P) transhydrogenase subunit alpha